VDSTSVSNGLTLSGKDVQLGGTLTKATTITTSASNTIALAGLQSGATSDSILVVNPSSGVIRRLSPSVLGSATEPWYSTTTTKGATLNTENIYQMGKVGINFNNPTEQLEVNGNIFQRGYSYFKKNTGNTSAYIWTDFTSAGDAINYSFNYHNVASADTVFNSGYGTNTFSQKNAGFYFNTSNGINGVSPSINVMVITNAGRVGINTSNPTAKLHVIDSTNNTPLRLEGLTSGSVATDSVLVATSTGVVKRLSPSVLGSATEPWYSSVTSKGATSNSENIYQMGRVGVGTSNPAYQLDVRTNSNTSTQNAHFVNINSGTSAESQVGIGAGPGSWAKIVGYNDAIGFRNYTTGKENLTIRNGSGNIGIGTNNPICALHVEPTAATSYNLPNRQFFSGLNYSASSSFGNVGNVGAQTQSLQVAAYFGNRIQVNGFIESQAGALTLSDLRAKNIIGITNNEKDLNTLSKIQITDYKLKDIHLGQNEQKKVIAQQLDTVYPQAVITQNTPKLMPTVYDYPKEVVIEANQIKLVLNKASEYIKKGEKLVVRFKDKEYHINVLSIQNNEIGLDKNEELIKRNDIKDLFIYGTFVNDSKSVDYEAISMLNVSATQALLKKVNNLETENNELKKSIDYLLKEVQALKKIKK
jgi:hypothetical protein